MATGGKVDFYGRRDVKGRFVSASEAGMQAVAQQVLRYAREKIRENRQFVTGFMLNSGYIRGTKSSTYQATADVRLAPEAALGSYTCLVAFGAVYAAYQELRKSFLYAALQRAAAESGGEFQLAARQEWTR